MTAIDVVTKYEELNCVLYEHGKSNRKHYDVSYHEGEYERKTSEMMRKQSEASKEFLVKNQETILISVRDMIKVTIECCEPSNAHYFHGRVAIFPGDYERLEELEEEECNRYLVQMIASLTESVCSIERFYMGYSEIGFCPFHQTQLMKLEFVARFNG